MFDENQRSGDDTLSIQDRELKTIALSLLYNCKEAEDLFNSMKANYADCMSIMKEEEDSWKLWKYTKILYSKTKIEDIRNKTGQNEVIIQSISSKQLKSRKGDEKFKEYYSISEKICDDLTLYSFSYVYPAASIGIRYDAFLYTNGNWIFLPKMWRAF